MPRSESSSTARRRGEVNLLSALTGVRSGKNSYYRELRLTEERMTGAVRALEVISTALVHTRDDPRGLLHEVLHTAAGHLGSDWTMMALRASALPGLRPRFLALGPDTRFVSSDLSLPPRLRSALSATDHEIGVEAVVQDGWVRVPMILDGQVLGQLVASRSAGLDVEHEDLWVLRILVNQAAVAMHTATMHATATAMRAEAQDLYDEFARSSQDLEVRTAELAQANDRLRRLQQRELLDAERHRIALELHDSVAQYVLSAGYAVDVCRADAVDHGHDPAAIERLVGARDLIAIAGDQIRSVIYALHHEPSGGESASLPALLEGLAAQHRHDLDFTLRVAGRPVSLDPDSVHALARIAGEALFNVASHAKAARAVVDLRFRPARLTMSIADDGMGDPRELRRMLRLEQRGDSDGRHQGLAGMALRAKGIDAGFAVRRATIGGIRVDVTLPITPPVPADTDGPAEATRHDEQGVPT